MRVSAWTGYTTAICAMTCIVAGIGAQEIDPAKVETGGNLASINAKASELLSSAAVGLARKKYDEVLLHASAAIGLLPDDPRVQQRAAELLYRSGHVQQSLAAFDRANELDRSRADHNWQRGIALASAGEYKAGATQFWNHHRVNPDDVENTAWHFLCVAKSDSLEAARKSLLPSRGDERQPMMSILAMFRGELGPQQLLEQLGALPKSQESDQLALFYAYLYIGLYYDAIGQKAEAITYLEQSMKIDISGYMTDAARVYYLHRLKDSSPADSNDHP